MTRARTLSRLANATVLTVDGSNNVGINSTIPDVKLDVIGDAEISGVITATSFSGSGSGLTGVASTDNIITSTASTMADIYSTGIVTATTFVGALTGNASGSSGSCSGNAATATLATNASGLTGSPNITINNLIGVAATFSGVVTYEDVTNIDSVGIVTAGGGLYVGRTSIGATFTTAGDAILAGVVTATSFSGDGSGLSGVESWNQQDTWLYGGG